MKSIKIYANVANAVQVNITNNNAFTGRPYIQIQDSIDGSILTFYSAEDYQAYATFKREEQK